MMLGSSSSPRHRPSPAETHLRPEPLIWMLGVMLLTVLTACRSPSRSPGDAEDPAQAAYWSEEAVERRVQGHAHYGAAILAEAGGRG